MPKNGLELARELARDIIEDPEYLESLKKRARAGTLAPEVEEMLLHYAFEPPRFESNLRLLKGGEPSETN